MSGKAYIKITGVGQTMTALKAFEPEVYKVLRKGIRTKLRSVGRGASGRYGGKYKVSIRDAGRRPGASVEGVMGPQPKGRNDWSSPQTRAVIFEFAQNATRPGTRAAIQSFQTRFGSPGRFLWEEWDSQGGKRISEEIAGDIREAEKVLQAKLDAAGEGY